MGLSSRIEILGPVRAWRGGQEIGLGPPQQRGVLSLLAAANGHPVAMPDLIDVLWGTAPPPSAVNVVQTYLKRLRRLLDPDRPPRRPSTLLPSVGDGYALRATVPDVDLWRFRALVDAARGARRFADPGRAATVLAEALALWKGPPACDTPVGRHPRLLPVAEERWRAVAWFAEAALASGRAAEAMADVEAAAVACPFDEPLHAHLIRIYHAVGRRCDAVRVYHDARRRLSEELGFDPGPELAAAYRALLRDDLHPVAVR